MVVAHEAHVGHQRSEIFPAGKRLRLDQEAIEVAMLLDIGVHGAGERDEIFGPQRALGLQSQDTSFAQQFVMDHVRLLRSCNCEMPLSARLTAGTAPARFVPVTISSVDHQNAQWRHDRMVRDPFISSAPESGRTKLTLLHPCPSRSSPRISQT